MFTVSRVPFVRTFRIIHVTALSAESAEIGQMVTRQLRVSVRFSSSDIKRSRVKE